MLGMCTYFFKKIHLGGLTLTDGFSFTVLGGNIFGHFGRNFKSTL